MPVAPTSLLCIGLMSGTSMDGVDGVLARIQPPEQTGNNWLIQQHAFVSIAMPTSLSAELLALNISGKDELHRAALAANALMQLYAQCVNSLCEQANVTAQQVAVIGAHGQTIRHRPQMFDQTGYTLQLANGALLAELTGIAVACDFRSRDVAAGGQGAPLAPAFHQALWGADNTGLAVLNLGGMANLSVLQPGLPVLGMDCGPANALLDYWCQRHIGHPYDENGIWAAQGQIHSPLLSKLLAEPFVLQTPPKSTGRDLFNPDWLIQQLSTFTDVPAVDVQATLTAYTAQAAALHVQRHAPSIRKLIVCGGGVRNSQIMRHLTQALPEIQVVSSQTLGINPQAVESIAFAWLGYQTLQRLPLDMHTITGARAMRVLGCLYPA